MTETAHSFAGGIERIDARGSGSRRGLSLRAVILGLLGVVFLSMAVPYNGNVLENTMLIGNHLPIGVVFIILVLVLAVNPVLIHLPRAAGRSDPSRMAVIWACLLPASLWAWHGPISPDTQLPSGEGLSGTVVLAVCLPTGTLLAAISLFGAWLTRRGHVAFIQRLGVPLVIAVCVFTVLLAPVWTAWLDAEPPSSSVVTRTTRIYCLLTLVLLAAGLVAPRVLARIEPLSTAELVVISTMMLVACVAPSSGFHRLWAPQLIAPFYHLQGSPRWQPLVEYLPPWLVPAADSANHDVVYNFYRGQATVPWGPWLRVGVAWAPFVLAFFVGSLFLMGLLRRQWEEAEKLSFPLAAIALEALRPPAPGRLLNDMFRSRLFWWSTAIVVAIQTCYGLHAYIPEVPEIVFKYNLYPALDAPPWRHLPDWIKAKDAFFAAVGVAFFLATDMSFSLWAFVIILGLVQMVGMSFQYPVQEQFNDHQIGAYIAYAGIIVWIARRHLGLALRSIWRPSLQPPHGDHLSERSAAIGFLFCVIVAIVWLCFAGLAVHVAILTTLVIFLLALVVGRVVAESGLLFVQYNCWPHLLAESAFGSLLTPKSHTLIHFTTISATMDQREGLMPYAFNSARMADGVGHLHRRRSLFFIWIGCLILALVVAGAANLVITYHRGATLTDEWAGKLLPERTYNSSADFADLLQQSPERIDEVRTQHHTRIATGAAVILLLCFLRYRFLAWPLHPIGFIMANTVPMQVFWLSILIGWLCKTLVMRLGGVPAYRRLAPLFFGMIVGTTISSIFWILVKAACYAGGEMGKAVLFLPS